MGIKGHLWEWVPFSLGFHSPLGLLTPQLVFWCFLSVLFFGVDFLLQFCCLLRLAGSSLVVNLSFSRSVVMI